MTQAPDDVNAHAVPDKVPADLSNVPSVLRGYVRSVERVNRTIGRITMWGIFAMMGVLLWSTVSKNVPGLLPSVWTLEMAQFLMVAYFVLGGPYSVELDAHVRMDLAYGRWSDRTKAIVDSVTVLFLLTYLGFLLYGGISSTAYALEYGERSYSAWRPYMAPIKIVMVVGILLMLLQVTAVMIRNVSAAMEGARR